MCLCQIDLNEICFSHPEEMTRVEKLIAQVVDEVKPNEEEDVDAHPDHL